MQNSMTPEQMALSMLENKAKENPICANLLDLIKSNQTQKIETVVRNIFKEQGLDYDMEFNNFKKFLGFLN